MEGPAIYLQTKVKEVLAGIFEQKWTHEHVLFWKHFGLSIKNHSTLAASVLERLKSSRIEVSE